MKFSTKEYVISENEEMKIRWRRGDFIEATKTHKAVHVTLITPYGLRQNTHSAIVQNQITLNELFTL